MTRRGDLHFEITASTDQLGQELDAARRQLDGAARQSGGAALAFGRLGVAAGAGAVAIAAMYAALKAGQEIARAGDTFNRIIGQLQALTGSAGAAGAAFEGIRSIAAQTGASIVETAQQFNRFALAAREIGRTQEETLGLIRVVQQLGAVSGASAQDAESASTQLAQALASGRLQGDELRSILEAMPTLADLLARNLGVSVGQLRDLGTQGQLTSEKVFGALLKGADEVQKKFEELPASLDRAGGRLSNEFQTFLAELDKAFGLSSAVAANLDRAADALNRVNARNGAAGPLAQLNLAIEERAALTERLEKVQGRNVRAEGTLQTRINQLDAEIAKLNAAAVAELEAADARRAQEQAAAATKREENALAVVRAELKTATDGLATVEDRARKSFADRVDVFTRAKAAGLLNEAEYTRLHSLALLDLNEALEKATPSLTAHARALQSVVNEYSGLEERDRADDMAARLGLFGPDFLADLEYRNELLEEGRRITEQYLTPAEQFADTQDRLNELLSAGAISATTYARALEAVDPALVQLKKIAASADDLPEDDAVTALISEAL